MAHLWITTEEQEWAMLALEDDAFTLTTTPPQPVRHASGSDDSVSNVLLVRTRCPEATAWVLIAGGGSGVMVNGIPLVSGIRVISDRDEIRIAAEKSMYFSNESLARIDEFTGSDQVLYCPRCQQEIAIGTMAVKCPQCGVWHHEIDDLNCWTYAEVCALCTHSTDLNAGFKWTPEEL